MANLRESHSAGYLVVATPYLQAQEETNKSEKEKNKSYSNQITFLEGQFSDYFYSPLCKNLVIIH